MKLSEQFATIINRLQETNKQCLDLIEESVTRGEAVLASLKESDCWIEE